ncbi:prominin-1-A-like [Glandiceps talaboti]
MKFRTRTLPLVAVILTVLVSLCLVDSRRLTNSVSPNGHISFADLPEKEDYVTDTTFKKDTLQQFIEIARSFINVIQRKLVPYKLIRELFKGEVEIADKYRQIIDYEIGFLVCAAIGILFIVFMPIVGLCFCCCRLCGRCGGEMMQERDKFSDCKRTAFGITLFLIVAAMTIGVVCTYVSNENMNESVSHMQGTIETNMADIEKYINNSLKEFDFLVLNQYSYVNGLIMKELNTERVKEIVGDPLYANLSVVVNPAIDSVATMGTTMYRSQKALAAVDDSANELQTKSNTLQVQLSNVKTALDATLASASCNIDPACSSLRDNLDTNLLTTAADYSTIDISEELDAVNDALQENITALALEARQRFDELPELVVNKSRDPIEDVRTRLNDFGEQVAKIADDMKDPIKQVQDQMQIQDQLGDVFFYAKQYSKYIWYIGTTLMGFVLVIVTFYFMGLLCGVCGHEKDEAPVERGCMSNCGGAMLMGGVLFCFIFAPLLMLLTTLSFLLGGNIEKLVCEPLQTRDFFVKIVDFPNLLDPSAEYFLGKAVLKDGSVPLTVNGILDACKEDGAIYDVMMLEHIVNISKLVDYRSEFPELENIITDLDIDLSDVHILDEDTKNSLEEFNVTGVDSIDFDGYLTEIRKGITAANLTEVITLMDTAATHMSDPTIKTDIESYATDLRNIQDNDVNDMKAIVDVLEVNIENLKAESVTLQSDIRSVLDSAGATQEYIQVTGDEVIKSYLLVFQDSVLRYADQYAAYVHRVVYQDLGTCLPVWNLFESMHIAICFYVIDSFNCFWFSLGWSLFFFIPSIILAVKLSKHYRRMEYEEGCQEDVTSYKEEVPLEMFHQSGYPDNRPVRVLPPTAVVTPK